LDALASRVPGRRLTAVDTTVTYQQTSARGSLRGGGGQVLQGQAHRLQDQQCTRAAISKQLPRPAKLSKYFDQSRNFRSREWLQSGRRLKGCEFHLVTPVSKISAIKFSVVLRKFLKNFRFETFPKVIDG
jgi:hypothetical protein